jgi:hypothetical protein
MADSVTRLIFAVEGRTEDNFVRNSLRDHLWGFGLASSSTIVGKAKAAARGNSARGVRGAGRWLLCRLGDNFPMRNRIASDHSQADRCDRLQQVLADKINDWRFIPYIQLHEFEALVMACLPFLESLYDNHEQLNGLASLQIEVASLQPEEINDSRAPSKRLLRHIPDYRKATDGPDAIHKAGLTLVRNHCPRFDAWIMRLESLSETKVSVQL